MHDIATLTTTILHRIGTGHITGRKVLDALLHEVGKNGFTLQAYYRAASVTRPDEGYGLDRIKEVAAAALGLEHSLKPLEGAAE
jgi:hypothetical protein